MNKLRSVSFTTLSLAAVKICNEKRSSEKQKANPDLGNAPGFREEGHEDHGEAELSKPDRTTALLIVGRRPREQVASEQQLRQAD